MGTVTNDPLNILTNNTSAIFIDASQRVGIGTAIPDSAFHIKASIPGPGEVGSHFAGQLIIQSPTDSVFSNVVITAYESDGDGNPDQQLWYLGSASSGNTDIIYLNRRNAKLALGTNDITRITILGNGNVGINTTSPDTKLQVVGNTKLGDDNTNYTQIDNAGHMTFIGSATVFSDLQFPISNAKVPASNAPDWETFTANTNEYGFAVDDYIDTQANEVTHGWKLGSTGHVHAHITTKAANATGSNRFAKFTVVVAYCDTGETWQESSFTAELTIPNGTSALEQFYLDMGNLTLTNYVEEAEVRCRITRIDATGGTEYSGNIFITQVGIHLEEDTVGTNTENSK